ncbi:hypothetical protein B0H10DRAFT_1955918 [Mycena sp. CBHHK59/15]|nr:hypothetical protein B0H10DRAFT_1955918 [Mycena sp. CBHHK59/15]
MENEGSLNCWEFCCCTHMGACILPQWSTHARVFESRSRCGVQRREVSASLRGVGSCMQRQWMSQEGAQLHEKAVWQCWDRPEAAGAGDCEIVGEQGGYVVGGGSETCGCTMNCTVSLSVSLSPADSIPFMELISSIFSSLFSIELAPAAITEQFGKLWKPTNITITLESEMNETC